MLKFAFVVCCAALASAEPEAKADADPALLYGAYPYAGAYGGYPATYGYGYRTYGAYPYSYYGKRSADAEPKADAYYGAYGYGLPLAGYGYARSYAYGAHPYAFGVYGK